MKKLILRNLFLLSFVFATSYSFAQKHFVLSINLPPDIKKEKMEVWLEKGKGGRVEKLKNDWTADGTLLVKGEYYSRYAVVNLQYMLNPPLSGFVHTFFVQEKPGKIKFYKSGSGANKDKEYNYSLENVVEFKEEKKRLEECTALERKQAAAYEEKYGDKVFNNEDTAVKNYFNALVNDFRRKQLQYVLKYPQSYYSFYIFRSDVASSKSIDPDSLLLAFNSFPDRFKYSDEGNYLHDAILGRMPMKNSSAAINFVATDINKKKVVLSSFKGKKYVLLQFWATWCTPCMREVEAIKKINNQYQSKGLQIISIGLKSNYSEHVKTINKKGMNWIHIYNDQDLINKYGNQPVPRLCLIDLSGKMIYDSLGLADENDFQLKELNHLLEERLN